MTKNRVSCGAIVASLLLAAFLGGAHAGPLPNATKAILDKLHLQPEILGNVDEELRLPDGWAEKAREEGGLQVASTATPGEAEILLGPFRERYPFISVEHVGVSRKQKVRILMSHRAGRVTTDLLFGVGGTFAQWKEAGAVVDMRDIPNVKKLPPEAMDPDGLWVGINTRYWCMSYNTNLVNERDLPRRWEDLLGNPRWRGGKLALGNRPNLWALALWDSEGEGWVKRYLTRLFAELEPQLRKEGMSALGQLVAAGELHAAIPAGEARTRQIALKGAPIGYNCPEPVPVALEEAIVLKGAPHEDAAKLFMNWFLSKEGQIAQWASGNVPPVRADLMRPEFNPWPKETLGRKLSYRDPGLETEVLPELLAFWNDLWLRGGGRPR